MKPELDHNVYILGAGFSRDAGLPLVNDFLERMGDCLESDSLQPRGREAIQKVFEFRLKAAAAAYRAMLNVENIEELFSLASALEGQNDSDYIPTAIAATLDTTRRSNPNCRIQTMLLDPQTGQVTSSEGVRQPIPLYQLYAEILNGNFCDRREKAKNTIITFNYDTLLEDGLHGAGLPFTYGIPEPYAIYEQPNCTQDGTGLPVYKLHGSVNWSIDPSSSNKVRIYNSYDYVKAREERVFLVPPTWRKVFGEQLGAVWDGAVRALSDATRIVVLGFSMPPTDTHFKYLLIAGLQNNISLRKLLFVNPGLDPERYPLESHRLRENLFSILRLELEDRRLIELLPANTMQFLLTNETRKSIGRNYSSKSLAVTNEHGNKLSDQWQR
jgi:hypothetical protein